ncbi:MAG: hypothetical protein ACRDQH_03295 [Pseudonocardiaceae bacterium]
MTRLRAGQSPDQVAGRLRYEHPDQKARWVSHEAIYTWIYALPKGERARQGIVLRSGRTQRRLLLQTFAWLIHSRRPRGPPERRQRPLG